MVKFQFTSLLAALSLALFAAGANAGEQMTGGPSRAFTADEIIGVHFREISAKDPFLGKSIKKVSLGDKRLKKARKIMKKNSVVHFEIYADDPDKLVKFYTSLFDWTVEPIPAMDYRLIKTVEADAKGMPSQAGGINGGIMKRPAGYEGGWINYVHVESLEASIDRAQKLGATVMKGKTPVPGMGWFAMLTDPQGNPFALWQMDPKAK